MGAIMDYIPKNIGILPSDGVKAIKIRGQLHKIKNRTMTGYKMVCGKGASFGHIVYQIDRGNLGCIECQQE